MIDVLTHPMIHVMALVRAPVLENNAPWILRIPIIDLLLMDIPAVSDTKKGLHNPSASRSRSTSRIRFVPSANHTDSPNDSIREHRRLVSLHLASQCRPALLDHQARDLDLDLDPE
jgi:hypothetical protein